MEEVVFWGIWAVLGICMLCYYLRRKRKILSMLAGVGSGFLAGVLGVPGVILMVVLHFTL